MSEFFYQAMGPNEQLSTGTISAVSAAAALEQLESQGFTVLLVRKVDSKTVVRSVERAPVSSSVGEQILTERVGELLENRTTLGPALAAFAEEMPSGRARRELDDLAGRIESGTTSEQFALMPRFASTWLPLVGNRAEGGPTHLQDVLAEAEQQNANRNQLTRAMTYPAIVLGLAFLVSALLATLVIPTFEDIFRDFGINLPGSTRLVILFSHLVRFGFLPLLFVVAALVGVVYFCLKVVREWILPGRMFGVFLNGNSQQVSEMAVFVRRLAEALSAGISLPDALQLVGRDSRHRWLRREAQTLASDLAADPVESMHYLRRSALPATVAYALQAGPEGRPHVPLLRAVAETYADRVSDRFDLVSGFFPQFAIIVVGIAVGFVVMALFTPLVFLINGLTG